MDETADHLNNSRKEPVDPYNILSASNVHSRDTSNIIAQNDGYETDQRASLKKSPTRKLSKQKSTKKVLALDEIEEEYTSGDFMIVKKDLNYWKIHDNLVELILLKKYKHRQFKIQKIDGIIDEYKHNHDHKSKPHT